MKQLKTIALYISWLSIDVALGAMAGMLFFEQLFRTTLHWPAYLLLGLAVWSIYTLDHLLDVRKKDLQFSSRRAFHKANWKPLSILLGISVVSGLAGAFWWFGVGKELQLTLVLALLIVGSKLLVGKVGPGWMKELSISVFYVIGIFWLPLLRSSAAELVWQALLFVPIFIGIAFLNLLMLSYLDQDEDQQVGFFSAAWTLRPELLILWIQRLAIGLIVVSLMIFIGLPSFYRSFASIMLLMSLIHYLIFFQKNLSAEQKRLRMEASFMFPFLLLLL